MIDGGKIAGDGMGVTLCSIVANSKSAFLVVSPAFRSSVVVDGGSVSNVIISVAACLRKESRLISGNLTVCGKKATVSLFLSLRVSGK